MLILVTTAACGGEGILFEVVSPAAGAFELGIIVADGPIDVTRSTNATNVDVLYQNWHTTDSWQAAAGESYRLLLEDAPIDTDVYAVFRATAADTAAVAQALVGPVRAVPGKILRVEVTLPPVTDAAQVVDLACPKIGDWYLPPEDASNCDNDDWPFPEDCADWNNADSPATSRQCCNSAGGAPTSVQRRANLVPLGDGRYRCDVQTTCGSETSAPWEETREIEPDVVLADKNNELVELNPWITTDSAATQPSGCPVAGRYFCECVGVDLSQCNLENAGYAAMVTDFLNRGGVSRHLAACTGVLRKIDDPSSRLNDPGNLQFARVQALITYNSSAPFAAVLTANPRTLRDALTQWDTLTDAASPYLGTEIPWADAREVRILAQDGGASLWLGAPGVEATTDLDAALLLEPTRTVWPSDANGISAWLLTSVWALVDSSGTEYLFTMHVHGISDNNGVPSLELIADSGH